MLIALVIYSNTVYVCVCVCVCVYIQSRPAAGRQLVMDFSHLSQWLTTEKLGLDPTTAQSLSKLPILSEIEQGLGLLCGTTDYRYSTACLGEDCGVPTCTCISGYSSLPLWTEIAHYNIKDWLDCVL